MFQTNEDSSPLTGIVARKSQNQTVVCAECRGGILIQPQSIISALDKETATRGQSPVDPLDTILDPVDFGIRNLRLSRPGFHRGIEYAGPTGGTSDAAPGTHAQLPAPYIDGQRSAPPHS